MSCACIEDLPVLFPGTRVIPGYIGTSPSPPVCCHESDGALYGFSLLYAIVEKECLCSQGVKTDLRGVLVQCRVIYATSGVEVDWWCKRLLDPQLAAIGWDIEWKVTFKRGAGSIISAGCRLQAEIRQGQVWVEEAALMARDLILRGHVRTGIEH